MSSALAQELAQGRSREEIIDRLVADGWSVGNASHFLNYIDAATTLANCLYVQEEQGTSAQEPGTESREAMYGARSGAWDFVAGVGGLVSDIAASFRRIGMTPASSRRRRAKQGVEPRGRALGN